MASDGEISCTNDPNFAVIYSFLKVFGKLYGLDVPSITKFQEYIENTQEVLDPLKEIHLRLLRRALKSVQSTRWERSLIKFCHQHGHHQEAWEMERFSYKKASAQVKLKVLKLLLEYQFTCHPKFKTAVNALSCKDLRLDPIGRDKNGCVYWYQVDNDANLSLYKEDQDEETWQVVARNREELVKVITQLKNGEEVCPLITSSANEDSSSAEIPPQIESPKPEGDEENEEEFLSPESESEHEIETRNNEEESLEKEELKETERTKKIMEDNKENTQEDEDEEEGEGEKVEDVTKADSKVDETPVSTLKSNKEDPQEENAVKNKKEEEEVNETVSEAIEEPVMIVTGEGNGADCDSSYIIGDEITEDIMYFYGEGDGYDNDTGNPEVIEQQHSAEENTDAENGSEEFVNGEHDATNNDEVVKSVNLKSGLTSAKRSLKKQNNDTNEVLKSEPKKPCVRNEDSTDCANSTKSAGSATDSREGSVNDKSNTDNETPRKNNVKKGKVKKKRDLGNKLKYSDGKEALSSVTKSDNCHDSKTSIIEKRKSSVSSVDQDDHDHTENEKEKSPDKEVKVEDPLPPKKLRLDTPESDVKPSHSNKTLDNVNNCENNEENEKVKTKTEDVENSVSQRKKIKANKGKFKRKRILKVKAENDAENEESDGNTGVKAKKLNKSLKRTLLDATMSDKNKSESQSESEDDEPVTSGKRLKIKPKKIITSSRKKVEAKLREKHSSDESEEETLYSIAGKKSPKKVLKRKPKAKEKCKEKKKDKGAKGENSVKSEDSDVAPVRQSRRIAQLKIREEAERRHQEEVALREMKMIHKKKNKDDEEEWQASGSSSDGEPRRGRRGTDKWRGGDSTGPDQDSESDEPLFELQDDPDPVDNNKSDHEFSPESDLESGEPVEPLKRVRTLQEGKEDGVCARCGSGEQPEWILLCDKCDAGYHASCLKPMLFLVPEGDWFCPPCNHDMLISSLEAELTKYDELVVQVEAERVRRQQEESQKPSEVEQKGGKEDTEEKSHSDGDSSSNNSGWSSSSSSGAVYRLRARKQLPVSYRSQEYDRLISSAIKEEYVEPTTSAGNQGRGKDISTIIEAAEEEKMKAEREALEQGKPIEVKKLRKKTRRKPRKLNSLEVPSEDDDETDEDFKETGMESSSEDISSSAERDSSSDSGSDNLPIRRTGRTDKKDRPKLAESSPEVKKKKKVFEDSSSESAGAKEWAKEGKKSKSKPRPKRDKSTKKSKKKKSSGLTQYDAAGNVVRARVTYGGLSDEGPNDWSPKHRTRQKKINYTEMPNTESEDEMHKSSGKHMPDSSDEFKIDDSELSSDSDGERRKRPHEEDEKQRALSELVRKTAVVPLEKLPDDVTRAKTEQLEEHLKAQQDEQNGRSTGTEAPSGQATPLSTRGRGGRGGRGRGGRGRGRGGGDDGLAKLVGIKVKDLKTDGTPMKPNDIERAKKRQEREAKQAEKEARRLERLQKKEEKEKLKEQKAKEREEKKLARLALQESKRMKKEKMEFPMSGGLGPRPPAPDARLGFPSADFPDQRYPQQPRLQVRAELRGVAGPEERLHGLREGTLSVAGSPQPFKPITEEPSIITRMPHMINQQYRGPMMYPPGNSPYGPRGQNMPMYPLHHPGMNPAARHQYPPGYYPPQMRALPPAYPPGLRAETSSSPGPAPHRPPGHGPPGSSPHGPPGPGLHGPPGPGPHERSGPGPHGPPGLGPHGPPGPSSHGPPGPGTHGPPGSGPHGPLGSGLHGQPGSGPHGLPGSGPHGPPGSGPHGPPGSGPHGAPGPGPHGPPGPGPHGPPGPGPHGPPGPRAHGPSGPSSHRPPGPGSHGMPGPGQHGPHGPHAPPGHPGANSHRPLGHHGPPVSNPHGPPGHPGGGSHGPHGLPGHPIHGQLRPTIGPHGTLGPFGPHGSHRPHPHGSPGPNAHASPSNSQAHIGSGPHTPASPSPRAPAPTPPAPSSTPSTPSTTPAPPEQPVKIKAEVKMEPEYRTPPASPRPPSPREEPPRNHPKIKHTENKDRRPRYPLGPYAPQYGPYGPYAPSASGGPPQDGHSPLMNLQSRPPGPGQHPLQRMQQLHRLLPTSSAGGGEPRGPERVGSPLSRSPMPERAAADMMYLSAHIRSSRPPYFPSPMATRPPAPECSSPAGPPQYSSPYADHQRTALAKQLSAPPAMPLLAHQRDRLASPPGAPPATPPLGEATRPARAGSREPTPVELQHEEQGRPPPAPARSPPGPYVKLSEAPHKAPARPPPFAVKPEPARDEGSVFGGLVSYFSSQREDDIDA